MSQHIDLKNTFLAMLLGSLVFPIFGCVSKNIGNSSLSTQDYKKIQLVDLIVDSYLIEQYIESEITFHQKQPKLFLDCATSQDSVDKASTLLKKEFYTGWIVKKYRSDKLQKIESNRT